MFYLVAICVCAIILWGWLVHGHRWALAVGWGFALLGPTWFFRSLGPLNFDMRTTVCLYLTGLMAVAASVRWGARLLLLDILVVLLTGSLMVSQSLGGDKLSPAVLWSTFAAWMLPYLLGRLAFQTIPDFRASLWVAAGVCLVFCLWAMAESLTKVNPVSALANRGFAYGDEAQFRWGLKRAVGPLTHPIYFGLMVVMLLPWALEAYWLARQRAAVPRWWIWTPALLAGAVFFSMSRGPQAALIVALYGVAVYLLPRWRGYMIALGMMGVLTLAVGREVAWDALHVWSAEAEPERRMLIQIDGEYVQYSGTNHRWLQFLVYREALANAGAFGYGHLQKAVAAHVPGELQLYFKSIDNQYLFMIVTCGYVGTVLFLCVAGCAIYYMVYLLQQLPRSEGRVVAANLAALVAVMLTMLTVWLASDYSFLWLFNVGMAGSWYAHWIDQRDNAHQRMWYVQGPVSPVRRRRRLVPGHVLNDEWPSHKEELAGVGARQLTEEAEPPAHRLLSEGRPNRGTAPDVSADEA